MSQTPSNPIACLLSEADWAERNGQVARSVFDAVQEVRELSDGYAFRLPADHHWMNSAAAFVASERECCPFMLFTIRSGPGLAPVWLEIRGESDEVKEFIRCAFVEAKG